jgi:predicted Zn-dependent protease
MKTIQHKDFQQVAKNIFSKLQASESLSLGLHAENTKFLRFNQSKIRQATTLEQIMVDVNLQWQQRESKRTVFLGLDPKENLNRLTQALEILRLEIKLLPEDPYFVAHAYGEPSKTITKGNFLNDSEFENMALQSFEGLDLAGMYCEGPIVQAMINSQGLDHWFENETFFFDYSLFAGEKASKGGYAGLEFKTEEFLQGLKKTREFLELLKRPSIKVEPGQYRAYLAPAAFHEITSLLTWGAFSYGAVKRSQSSLTRLFQKEASLSPLLTMEENFERGLVPIFNEMGELSPIKIPMIEKGQGKELLVSSRSAVEYQVKSNGAGSGESFRSLKVQSGALDEKDALKELGTGLYLSNLHYLNYSDMPGGRITGMTRYACFWVEKGEIQGPIQDLRFDESLYKALGEKLVALTNKTEIFPSTSTYYARNVGAQEVPGALIDGFTFTL